MLDPKKQPAGSSSNPPSPSPEDELAISPTVDEFFARLRSDIHRPNQEAIAAALQTMQHLAAEAGADLGSDPSARTRAAATLACNACGHQNRPGNQFCGMCGLPLAVSAPPRAPEDAVAPFAGPSEPAALPQGQHHYHHHYHHHYYLAPGQDSSTGLVPGAVPTNTPGARLRTPGSSQAMTRGEAAVRKVMQDWTVACNSRQLDDLVSTYASDALVLRPNHPAVRGTAAIREFFFAALDAGLGEVEIDPQRVDVIGDVAYEAGRCKMLVPIAVGKRREERGKYLAVLARQANGEWRIVSDCWSSDLSLTKPADADPKPAAPPPIPQKPIPPRKAP